jgi:hypothetical protein
MVMQSESVIIMIHRHAAASVREVIHAHHRSPMQSRPCRAMLRAKAILSSREARVNRC